MLLASWTNVRRKIDDTGMYRTVTLGLGFLVLCSMLLGTFGLIAAGPFEQARSLVVAVAVALIINVACARLRRVSANHESAIITALILFFLVFPAAAWSDLRFIALAVASAMLSKYLIVWRGQHILNPAAFGAAALSVPGFYESVWWVGVPELFLPLVLAGGAVVLKVRKSLMVGTFLLAGFAVFLIEELRFTGTVENWDLFWLSYPALFLACFMLTEPFTMPPRRRQQFAYAVFVAFLAHTTVFMEVIAISPEFALLIGNLAFYPFTLRQKLVLTLVERREIARNIYEFVFEKPAGVRFRAGQYLEWMLPHREADSRGVRRYFTIASSPTERVLRFACKVGDKRSSYKEQLLALAAGDRIIASQCSGDFLLPPEAHRKLGWIAGGIGITPFRSQAQYMLDTNRSHDTVLFYGAQTAADIAYREVFTAVPTLQLVPVLAEERAAGAETGRLDADMIKRLAPDFRERAWYISGPPPMVDATYALLRSLGVPKQAITRDFFPGVA